MSNRKKGAADEVAETMEAAAPPLAAAAETAMRRPVLMVRRGRGNTGGSTGLDLYIQRGRVQGRRVRPLDGDLRSKTLRTLYPAAATDGTPIQDGATWPEAAEFEHVRLWLQAQFDQMVAEGFSGALDLGGGERVMEELVRDLDLPAFCRDMGIGLTAAFFVGPDREDFEHVLEIEASGDLDGANTLIVLNEGVIRGRQTPEGIFDPILRSPEMDRLMAKGARPVFLRKFARLDELRRRRMGFFDAIAGLPDPDGVPCGATLQHQTKTVVLAHEAWHEKAGTLEWLP